jgi:hypothetical protein
MKSYRFFILLCFLLTILLPIKGAAAESYGTGMTYNRSSTNVSPLPFIFGATITFKYGINTDNVSATNGLFNFGSGTGELTLWEANGTYHLRVTPNASASGNVNLIGFDSPSLDGVVKVTGSSGTNLILGVLTGTLPSDDTYESATPITGKTAGESITQWDLVKLNSSGQWIQADRDASGEFPAHGIAVSSASASGSLTVIRSGVVRNDGWNWTVGATLYLDATAGGLTETAPSTSTHCFQAVGFAISADIVSFNIGAHHIVP